jgi:hypothetical protein
MQSIGTKTMSNSEYLIFLLKFILAVLGFGLLTNALGNYVEGFKVFTAPLDLIFIITLVYVNRNKFSEILTTLEN